MKHRIILACILGVLVLGVAEPARADFDLTCQGQGGNRICHAISWGRSVQYNQHVASLVYQCNAPKDEWMYIVFRTDGVVDMDVESLDVTWRTNRRRELGKINVRMDKVGRGATGTSIYYGFIFAGKVFQQMVRSDRLYAKVPFERHTRPLTVEFDVRNARHAFTEAVGDCGLQFSFVK